MDAQWNAKMGKKEDLRDEGAKLASFLVDNDHVKLSALYSDLSVIGPCGLNMRNVYRLAKFINAVHKKNAPNSPALAEWETSIDTECQGLFQAKKVLILFCIGTKSTIATLVPPFSAPMRLTLFDNLLKEANGPLCAALYHNTVVLNRQIVGMSFPNLFDSRQKVVSARVGEYIDLPCLRHKSEPIQVPPIDEFLDR